MNSTGELSAATVDTTSSGKPATTGTFAPESAILLAPTRTTNTLTGAVPKSTSSLVTGT